MTARTTNVESTRDPARPRPYAPLIVVLSAACGGIVLDRTSALPVAWWWPAAAATWTAWWLLWRRGSLRLAACALLASVAATAAAWHHCRWSLFDADELGLFAREVAEPAALEARATSGSRRVPAPPFDPLSTIATPERTRIEVQFVRLRDDDAWRDVSGTATLFIDGHLSDVRPGDVLRIFGALGAVRAPANPGEFDYAASARRERRLCTLHAEFPECVTTIAAGARWSARRVVDSLRAGGDAQLWRAVGPGRSGLASAMFLGEREELQPELTQAFMETGTIHLLVISGLNVGILATCLFLAMRVGLVPRGWALGLVAVACLLYAATTDAQPPVVRATVMVLVACLAMVLGRRALGFNSIAAAGLVVLALNPAELFQAGTQLSFLCVAVLAWFSESRLGVRRLDALERLIARTRPWYRRAAAWAGGVAWRTTLVSLIIWLLICPLVMARFHLLSPVAVVLGPLLAAPVALAMAAGFGIFAVGWLAPSLARVLGWVCEANLSFMQECVQGSRTFPGNHVWIGGPSDWWLAGFYGAMFAWLFVPRWAPPWRWRLGLLAGWIAIGMFLALHGAQRRGRLECTFLSVGHGEAVVVELPNGRTLLYDCGRLGSPTAASRAVAGYLWSRGIRRLDAVIVSHADADHYNALPAIAERFAIDAVYVSPVMFLGRGGALAALHTAIEKHDIPLREVYGGDRLRAGDDVRIEVLHPPRSGVLGSDNANSIVLAIEYQGRRLLLTGDLESPGLDDVMAEEPYDCDVVLAPHHGSAFSDPPGFAQWCSPEWTVVSGGQRDRLASVTNAYAARGSRVLHTATCGAVRVAIDGGQLAVACWHSAEE